MGAPSGGLVDAIRAALADVHVEVDVGALEALGPDAETVAEAVLARLLDDRRAPRAHDIADLIASLVPTAADIAEVLDSLGTERRARQEAERATAAADHRAMLVALTERIWLQLESMEDRHRSSVAAMSSMSETLDNSTRRITSRLNGAVALLEDEVRAATELLSRDIDALRSEMRSVGQLRATVDRLSAELDQVRAIVDRIDEPHRPHLTALEGGGA